MTDRKLSKEIQKEKVYEACDLLIELDFVKRELYELISENLSLVFERDRARHGMNDLQSQMEETIEGYQQVIIES